VQDRRTDRPPDIEQEDRGASLVEYALLLALIALVCFAAIIALGGNVGDSLSTSGSSIFGG
jgi:Flp pilus assembly pilin Flp